MIMSLEELQNLQVLGLSVFMVNQDINGYDEFVNFSYRLTEDGMICLSDGRKNVNTNSVIAHFGITSQKIKSLKYPDSCRLFGDEEAAQQYARLGLHKRAKAYAEAKRTLLCGNR